MGEQTYGGRNLPTLGHTLRQHWLLLMVFLVVGVGAGALYAANVQRTYTASATVLLNPLVANPLSPEAASGSGAQLTIALETEAEVVASPVVAESVSDRLDRFVPGDDESLSVQVPSGTQMVRISFTSSSPQAAAEGAQAFAEEFLAYRQGRTAASKDTSLESLQKQLDETERSLREAIADSEREGADSFASRQVDLFADRMALISGKVSTTESLASDPGRVLGPAEAPSAPNEIAPSMAIAFGALAGLALGVALSWYLEWRKDAVGADETVEVSGVPVLASVGVRGRLDHTVRSPAVQEAFRRLRVGVVANAPRPHVLAVASLDGAGSSVVAAQIAGAIAEAQYDVAFVATDPRDRAYEKMLGIRPDAKGLSELLTEGAETTTGDPGGGLRVIPAGAEAMTARDLYAGQGFRRIITSLRQAHDYVIIAAAGAGTADGDAVISAADSLLMIVTPSRTTHQEVTAALERCTHLGITVMGAVSVMSRRGDQTTGDAAPVR